MRQKCGVNAIKLQTYTPDTITIRSKEKFKINSSKSLWKGKDLYSLYKEAYTPFEIKQIFDEAKK